jgi:hypothetical protein
MQPYVPTPSRIRCIQRLQEIYQEIKLIIFMKMMKKLLKNLSWPNTRSRISSDQGVWLLAGARRAFTSATSAGVNVHEAALTLLRTWSSVVAPEMTEQT